MEGREGTRAGLSLPEITPGMPRAGGLVRDEAMGLPLGTPPAWWPLQEAGGGQLGCGVLERFPQTAADLGAAAASKSHRSPLGHCPLVSPQPFLRGSGSQSTRAGGDHDFLPSRWRREEKGPHVRTDLSEEGKLRKISVQPFPAVHRSPGQLRVAKL